MGAAVAPAVAQAHMAAAVVPAMSIRHLRVLERGVRDLVAMTDQVKVKVMKELVAAEAAVTLQAEAEAEAEAIATVMQEQEAHPAAIRVGAMAAMRVCGLR